MFEGVRAVMVFADDPAASAEWWAEVLGVAAHVEVSEHGDVFAWLDVAGVEFGFHPADEARNPRGGSPVVYWAVDDLEAARRRLLAAGCVHHRGPLEVSPGRRIAQVRDPFGTVVGLDGP